MAETGGLAEVVAGGVERGPLPAGFRLSPDAGLRRTDGGRVLIGGYPLRILRLSAAGARTVDDWWSGGPVGGSDGGQRLARRLLDAGMAHPRPDGTTAPEQEVTLVVPAHGRAGGVARVLEAVRPHVAAAIVVDDGSPDPRALSRAATGGGAVVLRNQVAQGPAAARNRGWREAVTDVVLFVDTDCADPRPGPSWLGRLVVHLADPAVAAVAPRVVAAPGDAPRFLAAYERVRSPLDRGSREGPVRPRSRIPFVPAAVLLARREALEDVGGFEDSLTVGEDVDLVWRLVEAGWTVRYEPATTVSHDSRGGLRPWLAQRYRYGSSAASLEERHPRAATPLTVSPWTALAWTAAGSGHPVVGGAVAAGTTALLAPRLRELDHPWREAWRLAGRGHLAGGRLVADAARRVWWPLVAGAALISRRGRRVAAALILAPPAAELIGSKLIQSGRAHGVADPIRLGPLGWTGLRLADDLAYGAGVWAGALRARRIGALLPDLTWWPGSRPAVEPTSRAHETAGDLRVDQST